MLVCGDSGTFCADREIFRKENSVMDLSGIAGFFSGVWVCDIYLRNNPGDMLFVLGCTAGKEI